MPRRTDRPGPRAVLIATLGMTLVGCQDPPPADPDGEAEPSGAPETPAPPSPGLPGDEIFDREIVFLSADSDSLVLVPWLFHSRASSNGIRREETVLLHRGEAWEALASHRVDHPTSRSPWRIAPGPTTGLVVGLGDRLETLVYRDPPRELEVSIGNQLIEWVRPGDVTVRLNDASALFPSGPVDGMIVDMNRRWSVVEDGRNAPGDWLIVQAGPMLQLYLAERVAPPDELSTRRYGGWSRLAFRDRAWDTVEITWSELRPFEPARRDVPATWDLATPDGSLAGELSALDSHLEAGEGDGPILPVSGVFAVAGTLRIDDEEFEVSGLLRHVQR